MESTIVRCSPSFQNSPRYDTVLIKLDQTVMFARLLGLFVVRPAQDPKHPGVPVALVLPYDAHITPAERRKDARFGLHRVRETSTGRPQLYFARSIIRGGLLVPVEDSQVDFYVFDVADGDMFLRVREITHCEKYYR